MVRPVLKGSTDQSVVFRFLDSTDGTPETGVSDATSGLALWYRREGGLKVAITPASLAALDTAHTDGGVEHISDGYVRIDPPDAAFASGANGVAFGGSATGMVVIGCYVHLTDFNLDGQSAIDLKDFADAGYDPATNKVQGVVLVDTLTTYTGNTVQTGDAYAIVNSGTHGNAALKTLIDAVDDFLDTEVAAILAAVDTEVAAILADTNELQTDWTNGGRLDLILDIIAADVVNLDGAAMRGTDSAGTAAELAKVPKSDGTVTWNATALSDIADAVMDEVVNASGITARLVLGYISPVQGAVDDVAPTSTSFKTSLTEANDFWNDSRLQFISGSLTGQTRPILDYAQTDGVVTFDEAFTAAPGVADAFIIVSDHIHPVTQIQSGLALASVCTEARLAELDAANLPTDVAAVKSDTAATLTDTNELQTDWADGGRLDSILDARASQTSVNTIDDFLDTEIAAILAAVDTEVAAILVDTGTDIPATLSGLFTTALTEAYRGTGATGSVRDILYEILANIVEFANSGTTRTTKKIDGTTTAKTYTYDDAVNPTSITETT